MAEEDLVQFLLKVGELNAFVALSEAQPDLRGALRDCSHHHEVVALARRHGFEIGRRWGDQQPLSTTSDHLTEGSCPAEGTEISSTLVETATFRLLRIHSCRASSPKGFWYDQQEHEWLTLMQGSARLQFEAENQVIELNRGDTLWITPGRRHRLVDSDPAPGTIWLALFWPSCSAEVGDNAPASKPPPG